MQVCKAMTVKQHVMISSGVLDSICKVTLKIWLTPPLPGDRLHFHSWNPLKKAHCLKTLLLHTEDPEAMLLHCTAQQIISWGRKGMFCPNQASDS